MSKKKLDTPEDFLESEPYRSIIHILRIAPDFDKTYEKGLMTMELKTLIVDGYEIKSNRISDDRKQMLVKFKNYLEEKHSDRVQLKQKFNLGSIRKKKTEKDKENMKKKRISSLEIIIQELQQITIHFLMDIWKVLRILGG